MPNSFATLGQYLRREREMRGVSLDEVSQETKVKRQFLEVIEAGEHRGLPSPIYVRGFLRSYAACIGLEAGDILQRYQEALDQQAAAEAQVSTPEPASTPPTTGAIVDRILRPADDSRMRDRRKDLVVGGIFGVHQGRNRIRGRSLLLGSVAGAAVLVVVGIYLLTQLLSTPKEKVLTYRENVARTLAADVPKPVRTHNEPTAGGPVLDTLPPKELAETSAPEAVSPPSPTRTAPPAAAHTTPEPPHAPTPPPLPVPTAVPVPAAGHHIIVEAHERSWLAVRIDDTTTKEFMLVPGDRIKLAARNGFDLTVGNAGGVTLSVDGKRHPPLGDHGQVVRDLHVP